MVILPKSAWRERERLHLRIEDASVRICDISSSEGDDFCDKSVSMKRNKVLAHS